MKCDCGRDFLPNKPSVIIIDIAGVECHTFFLDFGKEEKEKKTYTTVMGAISETMIL